jgi:hypothetical protein
MKISEATKAQLRNFANRDLGLMIQDHPSVTKAMIIAQIKTVSDVTEITVDEAPQPGKAPKTMIPLAEIPKNAIRSVENPEEMMAIFIEPENTEFGQEPVPVEVNAVKIWIPRGEKCMVKRKYVEVLQNAKCAIFAQDQNLENPMHSRDVLSYPVRVVDPKTGQAVYS